jgi:hypothetical protein
MLAALTCACGDVEPLSPSDIEVVYRCVACTSQAPAISFGIALANTSDAPIAIPELELRYWVVMTNPSNLVFTCDAADGPFGGCPNVRFEPSEISPPLPDTRVDRVLRLTFGAAAGQIAPGMQTPELRVAIARMSGNVIEQGNDYSFDRQKTELAKTTRIGVYRNDTLLWGEPPR